MTNSLTPFGFVFVRWMDQMSLEALRDDGLRRLDDGAMASHTFVAASVDEAKQFITQNLIEDFAQDAEADGLPVPVAADFKWSGGDLNSENWLDHGGDVVAYAYFTPLDNLLCEAGGPQ